MRMLERISGMNSALMLGAAAVLLALAPAAIARAQTGQHHGPHPQAAVPLDDLAALLADLRAGGLMLLVRHERTELPSREDDYTRAPDDCRAQRNLSVAGTAGAAESGVVLRALAIPIARVLSSPMCRATETARGMFGLGYENDLRLLHQNPAGTRNLAVASQEMRSLIKELAPGVPGSNIAIITHGAMIHQLTGVRLSEGAIAVVRVSNDGTITTLGDFLPSDLNPFAREALEQR